MVAHAGNRSIRFVSGRTVDNRAGFAVAFLNKSPILRFHVSRFSRMILFFRASDIAPALAQRTSHFQNVLCRFIVQALSLIIPLSVGRLVFSGGRLRRISFPKAMSED